MEVQILNELKNVGKITYQTFAEVKKMTALLERCAASLERSAAASERIEKMSQENRETYVAAVNESQTASAPRQNKRL